MKSNRNSNAGRKWQLNAGLCPCSIVASTICLFGLITGPASGDDPCTPLWSDELPGGGDLNGLPRSFLTVDGPLANESDSGPALYACGNFTRAGEVPANHIAKRDGHHWAPLGEGINHLGFALAVFDDGSGPALYVGGVFTIAGGEPAMNIARWDGASWSPVGPGFDGQVRTLAVHDDGNGPALYAGGFFSQTGGVPANGVAKWDGSQWSALGAGTNGGVQAILSFNDGQSQQLIIGGSFTEAGDMPANHIARWDGSAWHPMGEGFDDTVVDLEVIEDKNGPALIATGSFTSSSEASVEHVARWADGHWEQFGEGFGEGFSPWSLLFEDAGMGPSLYVGITGSHEDQPWPSRVVRWDGAEWQPIGVMHQGGVLALAVLSDGANPVLYAGGNIFTPSDPAIPGGVKRMMRFDGDKWLLPGEGITAQGGYGVFTAEFFDDGSDGEHLYIGGRFDHLGGIGTTNLLRWDGQHWNSIGTATYKSSITHPVYALTASELDGEPALYAGGLFTEIDGEPFSHIARWDGTTWSPVGGGVAEGTSWPLTSVFAIEEFDDGSGPMLIVGGAFTLAGEIEASNIAAWDGEDWHALGSGTDGYVNHIAVVDHGGGPSLYVSGVFNTAGGVDSGGLARWDGSEWHNVGSINAINWHYTPLAAHHGKLIVGDTVTLSDRTSYGPVAVFDGNSWAEWSEGYGWIPGWFETFDDGTGPTLYSGVFVQQGADDPMRALLKWDGSQWVVPTFGGVGSIDGQSQRYILAMAVSSSGEQLAIGGGFTHAGDSPSPHLAILNGCPALTPGDLNGDGVVDGADLLILLGAWGPCPDPLRHDCPADLNSDGVVDGADLLIVLANWS